MQCCFYSCVASFTFINDLIVVAVSFDPASFYGHHEFDLAIAGMFGGFSQQFYDGYHQLIPKAAGFASRHKLYLLFHNMNHWYGA